RLRHVGAATVEEVVDVDTADLGKFKRQVLLLMQKNKELGYVVHDELIAAIGNMNPLVRRDHQEHISFLQGLMVFIESEQERARLAEAMAKQLMREEEGEQKKKAASKEREMLKRVESAQSALRKKFPVVPAKLFDAIFK